MSAFVVDANVGIAANGQCPQADYACVAACCQALIDIEADGMVVLDEGMLILREYMGNLNMSGQPGLGDYFMRWVWENQAVGERCERVALTPREGNGDDFEEFPAAASLRGFDPSDRKYVAVALASSHAPEVLNATDTDWWHFRDALAQHAVRLHFLCPGLMAEEG